MEPLKHECGIAMIRLLKPLEYYQEKYGTLLYGLNKIYLLMEKQHNRGQEGAGLGCIYLKSRPGEEYIFRERAEGAGAITEIFDRVHTSQAQSQQHGVPMIDAPFVGEVYMGHLRYSTTGRSGITFVHPFLRRNNWRSRNLMLCGNFNMTNVDEIFADIVSRGQHPRTSSDTQILLEQIGESLDKHNQLLYNQLHAQGLDGPELTAAIESNISFKSVLQRPANTWDGGYVMCGATGSGDLFVMRDPHGIRPAYWYADDEIFVAASERPAILTAMNLTTSQVREITPGTALTVSKAGVITEERILPELDNRRCSFEHIYFSRAGEGTIYNERKALGRALVPRILQAVDNDLEHTVVSFIPNTAEVAYIGLCEGLNEHLNNEKLKAIKQLDPSACDYGEQLEAIMHRRVRIEKIAHKDIKLRTFIAEGNSRNDQAGHVYDVTYGQIQPGVDNLVVIDDSIVRGTTLKQSIVRILDRLRPKKIVIVSSSPQVRYPDYYGIDMSRMAEFCAFRAAVELLRKRGMQDVLQSVYSKCKAQQGKPKEEMVNYVKEIYAPFTDEEIASQIARMITSDDTQSQVEIIFQPLEGLHKACPSVPGDWYFSGNYPTPGGNRMVNNAYINFFEGNTAKR